MIPAYVSIMASGISEEQKEKEKQYKEYVIEHCRNVKNAWKRMKDNNKVVACLNAIPGFDKDVVDYLVSNHDNSKYSEAEWEPYRKNFFPLNDQEKFENENAFEEAWKHHYSHNFHHWNYWANYNSIDSMTTNYVTEMCCDWIAMSDKFGGDAYSWYQSQTDIKLGTSQKVWVQNILVNFYS